MKRGGKCEEKVRRGDKKKMKVRKREGEERYRREERINTRRDNRK